MDASNPVRVLIADDHTIVRDGLAAIIAQRKDMVVVAEAADGQQAVAQFVETQPDVTLMDLRMPVMDGVAATTLIRAQYPKAHIIVLTTYDTDEDIYRALRAGAQAYLLKNTARDELLDAIWAVYQGQTLIPPAIASTLAQRLGYSELTAREIEVLELMAHGDSNREISTKLFIAEGTVKAHINVIMNKMNVLNRTQAVTQALRRGLVQLN